MIRVKAYPQKQQFAGGNTNNMRSKEYNITNRDL